MSVNIASPQQVNPFLRIVGHLAPLHAPQPYTGNIVYQLAEPDLEEHPQGATAATVPILDTSRPDPTLIDPSLDVDESAGPCPAPPVGVGYAGLLPRQRFRFLQWAATDIAAPISPAYQQLFCAHLEARLLEETEVASAVRAELPRLAQSPAWSDSPALARTQLLAFWLDQDGAGLAAWLSVVPLLPDLTGIALGLQAHLGHPLDGRQVSALANHWPLQPTDAEPLPTDILSLHLSSLEASLGTRVLAYALAQLPPEARLPTPWRANHRNIRISLPQSDLRPPLLPLLRDLYSLPGHRTSTAPAISATVPPEENLPDRGWQLILEFGQSRSEYFHLVIGAAQKLPGYNQLLDENRQLVHRVVFKRSELRRFWRIWDYVQSWSTTRVYVNGEELEKWKIWPYSQYLK